MCRTGSLDWTVVANRSAWIYSAQHDGCPLPVWCRWPQSCPPEEVWSQTPCSPSWSSPAPEIGRRTIDQTRKEFCWTPCWGKAFNVPWDNWLFFQNKQLSLSPSNVLQCNRVCVSSLTESVASEEKNNATSETLTWPCNDFENSTVSLVCYQMRKTFQLSFLDEDKLESVCCLQRSKALWRYARLAGESPTLCAASRLWTKPISVRYFIPDATPVSMSISCMTLSWPSCFWCQRKIEGKTRGGGSEKTKQCECAILTAEW